MRLTYHLGNYTEGSESVLQHQGNRYRVDDILKLCNGKPLYILPVKKLTRLLGTTVPSVSDKKRIKESSLEYPIVLLGEDRFSGPFEAVLDGWHRLSKAVEERRVGIRTVCITPIELSTLEKV